MHEHHYNYSVASVLELQAQTASCPTCEWPLFEDKKGHVTPWEDVMQNFVFYSIM